MAGAVIRIRHRSRAMIPERIAIVALITAVVVAPIAMIAAVVDFAAIVSRILVIAAAMIAVSHRVNCATPEGGGQKRLADITFRSTSGGRRHRSFAGMCFEVTP